tara:strand:- start:46 stop:525 length:480 start_codon:yes stop_codon:yes gene_type:complete
MAFKMKLGNSPLSKKGKLSNFFKGLGKEGTKKRQDAQKAKNEGGLTNFEKRQAAKKAARKGNVKPKAKPKAKAKAKVGEFTTKKKLEGNLVPNQKLMKTKVDKKVNKSADNSTGVKRSDANKKPDHNKNLKGLKGLARRKYYDKNKLKYDKTIDFGPEF